MKLEELGWNDWFEGHRKETCASELKPARVIAVDRDRFIVRNEEGKFSATLTGNFLYAADSATAIPCVGDWVCVKRVDAENAATIHKVLPRKSFLRRKTPGNKIDFQLIGANIDVALVVQSCHYDFNLRRLERYLVMVKEGNVEPLIVLTKIDLISDDELAGLIARIRGMDISTKIFALTNVSGVGVDNIRESLLPGRTYCLIGSSGVGKSTLINRLLGRAELETKTVSETGEGRHATVRRRLLVLDQGALLIDTPGMREVGMLGANEGIDERFHDIMELMSNCRFSDCTHTNEPGCSIVDALNSGTLNEVHYGNYLRIVKESAFHEMSYADKRKKDKKFGKFVHSVMKHKSR